MRRRASRITIDNPRHGFTIVELLIVVVVIAILAAITIVAYNGIQNRAKASAMQSHLSQQAKKLALWKVQNSEQFPVDLDAARAQGMLIDTTDVEHITYSTSPNLANYCITAQRADGARYSVTSTTSTPVEGECVTNLAENPSFETDITGWTSYYQTGGWAGTTTRVSSGGAEGQSFRRITTTAVGTTGLNNGHVSQQRTAAPEGSVFSQGAWVRSSRSGTSVSPFIGWWSATNTWVATSNTSWSAPNANWTYLVLANRVNTNPTITATGPQIHMGAGSATPAAGDTFDIDGIMLTRSSAVYPYRDGNSEGWFWNGTPNNSTSTGPAIAL